MGAQVVPAWKSEQIPDSSAKKSLRPLGWPVPESGDTLFLPIARPTRGFVQTL